MNKNVNSSHLFYVSLFSGGTNGSNHFFIFELFLGKVFIFQSFQRGYELMKSLLNVKIFSAEEFVQDLKDLTGKNSNVRKEKIIKLFVYPGVNLNEIVKYFPDIPMLIHITDFSSCNRRPL